MAGERLQDFGVADPFLYVLRRRLDEIPFDAAHRVPPPPAPAGQEARETVPELVKGPLHLGEIPPGGSGARVRLGEVAHERRLRESMSGRPDDEHRGGRMRVLVLAWVEVEIESTQTPTAAVEVVDPHGRMPDRGPRNPAIPHPEYPARDREQSGPDLPELEIRTEQLRVEGVRFGAHDFGVVVQVPALERVRPRDIATLPGEQFLVVVPRARLGDARDLGHERLRRLRGPDHRVRRDVRREVF